LTIHKSEIPVDNAVLGEARCNHQVNHDMDDDEDLASCTANPIVESQIEAIVESEGLSVH
jgi:hypothetical protein